MKKLMLLTLLALPACAMDKSPTLKQSAVLLGLAATHTSGTLIAITKCTSPLPLAISLGVALGSDYLLTKYAKDSK